MLIFENNYGVMLEASFGSAQSPNIVRNNIFRFGPAIGWFGGVYISHSLYNYILNNLFYDLAGGVVMRYDYNGLEHNKVFNNVFSMVSFPLVIPNNGVAHDNTSDYNIFFGAGRSVMWNYEWWPPEARSNHYFSVNWPTASLMSLSSWQAVNWAAPGDAPFHNDMNSKEVEPIFNGVEYLDFSPLAESIVVDNGINFKREVPTDILGAKRPVGATTDIGPFEWQNTSGAPLPAKQRTAKK